jgi:hypothetical protein
MHLQRQLQGMCRGHAGERYHVSQVGSYVINGLCEVDR